MFDARTRAGVCQCHAEGTRWLGTGDAGGYRRADAVYNVTVPEGFDRTDLERYVDERRRGADFDLDGPGLLTGVDVANARCARADSVTAVATVGVSNPAPLPLEPDQTGSAGPTPDDAADWRPGTVNLVVGVDRALDSGALATLLATAVEAKAATLLDAAGIPGTTSDAAIVGCVPAAESAPFAGSATEIGAAARVCVRDAVRAGLAARYDGDTLPTVDGAAYGVVTDRETEVFEP